MVSLCDSPDRYIFQLTDGLFGKHLKISAELLMKIFPALKLTLWVLSTCLTWYHDTPLVPVQQTDLKITQLKHMHLENSCKVIITNPQKLEMKKEKIY